MFLDLDIPDDDPLRPAKMYVSTSAPGFRLFQHNNTIGWESDFIWLVVVNEEDGLDFKVKQTIDGTKEVQALWKDEELDTSQLKSLMEQDPAWDIFQLRATVLLQNRVEMQLQTLTRMHDVERELSVREMPWKIATHLRKLERDMLEAAVSVLEQQVCISYYELCEHDAHSDALRIEIRASRIQCCPNISGHSYSKR